VLAITVLSGHVAPSVDDNNRYLKLTPLGDRIRLAYTVFFGEIPGAGERLGMDRNHDGQIDDGEAKAFANQLAAQVASALQLEIDGKPEPVSWAVVDAGMGTPAVAAGAFSIDLIAYVCLPAAAGHHRVLARDRFHLPRPGETEVKVEDGPPGVTIDRAHVGSADDPTYDYRFTGAGGPLESDGLEVVFDVAANVPGGGDAACPASSAPRPSGGIAVVAIVTAGVLAVIAAFAAVLLRHRRVRARGGRPR
jgi:hypothetical protein